MNTMETKPKLWGERTRKHEAQKQTMTGTGGLHNKTGSVTKILNLTK